DSNECRTVIRAARAAVGKTTEEILGEMDAAGQAFGEAVKEKFGAKGEW
ncbi:MAG: RraA family protein, partial [Candidatus Hydrogenedentes bacterium]|nr:RraA family protein [Candidatus Hydrogenedentota bacterium]